MVGYGAASVLAIAVVVVLILVAAGGDSGGARGNVSSTFPGGGSVPEQKVFDVAQAAEDAGCTIRHVKGSGVATHTTSLDERVKYKTNPPTSGRHYEIPAEDGIYGKAPQDEALVHALEHGRVIIWAKTTLPEKDRADLRALVEEDDYQMFLVPRSNMPYAVAATAWNGEPAPGGTGRMLLCNKINQQTFDALRAFRDEHRSQGPEPIP